MKSYEDKYKFKVTWEPYILRPNLPPEGVEKPSSYGPNTAKAKRLINAGNNVGVEFSYKCNRFPNTMIAHCALEFALEQDPTGDKQNELQEIMFKSYFADGEYPDSERVLSLASAVGFDKDELEAYVNNELNQQKLQQRATFWLEQRLPDFPTFVMNGKKMFSGAQDPDDFLDAFDKVAKKIPRQA